MLLKIQSLYLDLKLYKTSITSIKYKKCSELPNCHKKSSSSISSDQAHCTNSSESSTEKLSGRSGQRASEKGFMEPKLTCFYLRSRIRSCTVQGNIRLVIIYIKMDNFSSGYRALQLST